MSTTQVLLVACASGVLAAVMAPAVEADPGERDRSRGVPTCDGVPATIVDDVPDEDEGTIRGTDGPDVIVALGKGDTIVAGAGDDLICAGSGADYIRAGSGDDVVWGGSDAAGVPDADVIFPGAGDDVVHGGPAPDEEPGRQIGDDLVVIESAGGARVVLPGSGSDGYVEAEDTDTLDGIFSVIVNGGGDDLVEAAPDTGFIQVKDGDDRVWAEGSDATVFTGGGADRVRGGGNVELGVGPDRSVGASDRALGMEGADVLVGRAGEDDRLAGSEGDDVIRGLSGDDLLTGDAGVDSLDGGAGRDDCRGGERVRRCEAGG